MRGNKISLLVINLDAIATPSNLNLQKGIAEAQAHEVHGMTYPERHVLSHVLQPPVHQASRRS